MRQENPEADGSPGVVYRGVIEGLYRGRYAPGQRLVEADLTRDFEVGRGSVREALNRLAAEGLVAMNLHRSAVVRALTRAEARDIIALLETLNGFSARLAAERIASGDSIARIESAFKTINDRAVQQDFLRYARARNQFHAAILTTGGNGALTRLMPGAGADLLRVQFRAYATVEDSVRLDDYRAIYEAIRAGDSRKAEAAAKLHMRRIGEAVAQLPDAAFAS
ncbi:MAG: GntR family transcriptional regulator [Hyphomicrobiales bacterium]|nr:GntR family transcriptional regulator [Hyphomicrobiales bacterium]